MENQDLILQAIEAAENSLQVAKRLVSGPVSSPVSLTTTTELSETEKLAGVIGEFNGEFLIAAEGKKFQVPPNYASKSLLTVGDALRMIEDDKTGEKRFKQIRKVERVKLSGALSKKEGRWCAVTEEGSFWVLAASVKHYQGEIGDAVVVLLPRDFKRRKAEWGAVVEIIKGETESLEREAGKEKEAGEVDLKKKQVKPRKKVVQEVGSEKVAEKEKEEVSPARKVFSNGVKKKEVKTEPKVEGEIDLEGVEEVTGEVEVEKAPKSEDKTGTRKKKEVDEEELR